MNYYECTLMHRPYEGAGLEPCQIGGQEFSDSMAAKSRGTARYEYLRRLKECCWTVLDGADYVDVGFQHIRVRALNTRPAALSQEVSRVAAKRGVPFARLGMRVQVGDWTGHIAGINSSSNWQVLFEDGPHAGQKLNCHPNWSISYFDEQGAVLMAFKGNS